MNERNRTLRRGWPAALAGAVVAAGTALWLVFTAETFLWFTNRAAIAGLACFGVGLIFGSERLVGLAAVPLLAASVLSAEAEAGVEIDLGRSLIIGCLWYIATELAWESIAWRTDTIRTRAIASQRTREIATVLIVTIVVGLLATWLTSVAPSRTLLLRTFAIGSVVVALAIALAKLNRTRFRPAADLDGQLSEASSKRS